jgi:hypothetical protein
MQLKFVTLLVLAALPAGAAAPDLETPFIRVRVSNFEDHLLAAVEVENRLLHAEGSIPPVSIGGPGRRWCDAITLRVEDPTGPVHPWRWKLDKPDCAASIQLDHQTTARLDYTLPAGTLAAIPRGDYQLVATLDLHDSGAGWQGRVGSYPTELRLPLAAAEEGRAVKPPPERRARPVPQVAKLLADETDPLRRRDLAFELERSLVDAPPTPVNAYSDGVVAHHLERVLDAMASPLPLFDMQGHDFRPDGHLVVDAKVAIYGAVTPGFRARVDKMPQGPGYPPERRAYAASTSFEQMQAAALQDWLAAEKTAVLVHPLRVKDGITRVALSIRAMGSAVYREPVWVGYYRRTPDGKTWSTLSMEPPPPESDSRDWLTNVHMRGPGRRTGGALSESERRQALGIWVERVDGLAAQPQWRDAEKRLFALEGAQDKTWLPLLEAAVKKPTSPLVHAALTFRIARLGGAPVQLAQLQQQLREVKLSGFEALGIEELWPLLDPHFQREAKYASGYERDEILAAFSKRTGRSGDASPGAARIWDNYAAVECQGARGHGTELYERTENGWRYVTSRETR